MRRQRQARPEKIKRKAHMKNCKRPLNYKRLYYKRLSANVHKKLQTSRASDGQHILQYNIPANMTSYVDKKLILPEMHLASQSILYMLVVVNHCYRLLLLLISFIYKKKYIYIFSFSNALIHCASLIYYCWI